MKRRDLLRSLVLFLSVFCLFGCSDEDESSDMIVDWAPVNLNLQIKDSKGNNLAEPSFSKILEGTILEYKGKEIPLSFKSAYEQPATKAYLATEMGFRVEYENFITKGVYVLQYGELDGAVDYENETFTIIWPDQSKDIITMSRKVNHKTMDAKTLWKLNGVNSSSPIIEITKDFK